MSAADEESILPVPNLHWQQLLFNVVHGSFGATPNPSTAAVELLAGIEADEMAPYYAALLADPLISKKLPSPVASTSKYGASSPSELLEKLEAVNKAEVDKLDAQLAKATDEEGEMEINAVLKSKASYYAKIGDQDKAITAHREAIEKGAGLGSQIDLTLSLIRIGLFFGNTSLITSSISQVKKLVEEGGDWDRRNRLKVYEGLHLLSIRDFKRGGELFLDALSTFTATELLDYHSFVSLAVLANTLVLPRTELKKKILNAPEVLQVVDELPHLRTFTHSLYNGNYQAFFASLAQVEQTYLLPSRLLNAHARYYVRELRIIAYAQLLESYRSVTLRSMADAFGVTDDFIDRELSRFIALSRLPAVIDKVHGVIETRRPDSKNAQYNQIIKDGDVLLNQLQKLSRTAL